MIRKYTGLLLFMAATLICAGTALAEKLEDMPGYIDLEWISIPDDADEIHDIDLGPVLLGIAADKDDGYPAIFTGFRISAGLAVVVGSTPVVRLATVFSKKYEVSTTLTVCASSWSAIPTVPSVSVRV